ncbi:MAG: ABC-type metal ion transport system, periplasmic component/surface adhesin [Rhodocyclales bacterium]|nr:ABC-type metal ion transport system, periplasmic component/surface adhesin [Rhodocyclales bacterium]
MRRKFLPMYLAVSMSALSTPAWAAEAHVHGLANLEVSIEGNTLSIAMESPLDNLIGFERAPKTPAEINKVRSMAASLRAADKVFVTNSQAACKPVSVKLASSALDPALLGEAPANTQAAVEHGEHADLDANFSFRCDKIAALNSLTVQLFDGFANMKTLDVKLVTPKRQHAARLTPTSRTMQW